MPPHHNSALNSPLPLTYPPPLLNRLGLITRIVFGENEEGVVNRKLPTGKPQTSLSLQESLSLTERCGTSSVHLL
jgi:hypothetical protein